MDLDKIYEKRFYSISLKELLAYPTIEQAAEAYAIRHDGNLPREMLIEDFLEGCSYNYENDVDLGIAADNFAIWHAGNFPKEMLVNNFKIASIYSKIFVSHRRNERLNELGI